MCSRKGETAPCCRRTPPASQTEAQSCTSVGTNLPDLLLGTLRWKLVTRVEGRWVHFNEPRDLASGNKELGTMNQALPNSRRSRGQSTIGNLQSTMRGRRAFAGPASRPTDSRRTDRRQNLSAYILLSAGQPQNHGFPCGSLTTKTRPGSYHKDTKGSGNMESESRTPSAANCRLQAVGNLSSFAPGYPRRAQPGWRPRVL